MMFWLGAVPAVVLVWVRTGLQESPVYRAEVAARGAGTGQAGAKPGSALLGLFRRGELRVTLASALLSVGVIGAGLVVWLPTLSGAGAPPDGRGPQRVRGLCHRRRRRVLGGFGSGGESLRLGRRDDLYTAAGGGSAVAGRKA